MISSRTLAALLPLGFLVACGTGTAPTTPTQPDTPTLTLTPPSININAGDAAVTFSAIVQNSSEAVTWVYSGPGTIAPSTGPVTSFTPPSSVESVQSGSLTAYLGSSGVEAVAAIAIYPASETPPEEPPTVEPPTPGPTPEPTPPTDPTPEPTPEVSVNIAEVDPVTLGADGKATVNLAATVENAASGTTYAWTAEGDNAGLVSFGSATSEDTTATFAGEGSYSLKLTVQSGSQTASDTVNVSVNPAPKTVEGTWDGSLNVGGTLYTFILELNQTGENVTGTWTDQGAAPLQVNGTFDGTTLAFSLLLNNEAVSTVIATVAGDDMTGSFKDSVSTIPLTAKKRPAP